MDITDDKLYKAQEIADNGFIKNTKNVSSYQYIYALIKNGILQGQNKCTNPKSQKPHWMVLGSEIKRYKREVEGIEV